MLYKIKYTAVVCSSLLLLLVSCKKKKTDVNPVISTVPQLELISVNKTTIQQFTDSIVFSIKYIDGDGDLGDTNADSLSLYVSDSRGSNLVEKYHIAPVAPSGKNIVVQGIWHIVLRNTILLNGNTTETASFTIKVKDRAKQWSNEILTPSITINP